VLANPADRAAAHEAACPRRDPRGPVFFSVSNDERWWV